MADAVIVIKAHALEVWQGLCATQRIIVPSIAKGEAHMYIPPGHSQGFSTDLSQIIDWEASIDEMNTIYANFDPAFKGSIHDGEVECLAYLKTHPDEDICFCTADGPAITALAMLGMTERGISFEEALRLIGQNRTFSRNERQYSQQFFQDRIEQGQVKRIRGEGLNKSST